MKKGYLYDMPLTEIIYDLFDQLKSRTRGYASLDYELLGYRKSEMVKLDILLNGSGRCSFLLSTKTGRHRGRHITEKLKDVIPRHV